LVNGSNFLWTLLRALIPLSGFAPHSNFLGDASHFQIVELGRPVTSLMCVLILRLALWVVVDNEKLRHFLNGSVIFIFKRDLVEVGTLKALL
jgi:hypothetical protein